MTTANSFLIGLALFLVALVPPLAVLAPEQVTAALGAVAFLPLITGYAREQARRRVATEGTEAAIVERARRSVEQRRRLAIYDQETPLLARWYFELRAREECVRAARYRHELSLLVVDVRGVDGDSWTARDHLGEWIADYTRSCDISSYLGNGRYAVLMPDTGGAGAATVAARMQAQDVPVALGVSNFPDGGDTFEDLYREARRRLEETGAFEPAAPESATAGAQQDAA